MAKSYRRRSLGFYLIVVVLLLMMVAVAAKSVTVARYYLDLSRHEDAWLLAAYGPAHWSNGPEEWIVRDFFQDRRGGVFVDVGAADAREHSNTYYLESRLGWSGIAVDALSAYGPSYVTYRPKTQFFPILVSDRSDDQAVIYVANATTETASVSREFAQLYAGDEQLTARKVATTTLNDLLVKANVTHIDFLSMDIELSEPMALAGFDLVRYKPALVTVETHTEVGQSLIDYFVARGYTVIFKYLRVDTDNLWFMPTRELPSR